MKTKLLTWRHFVGFLAVVLGVFVLVSYVQLKREVPEAEVVLPAGATAEEPAAAETTPLDVPMPNRGNVAVSVAGIGVVARSHDDQNRPIASITKLMTAYVVMTDHPLKAGDKGPEIIAEDQDLTTYRQQKANGESVIELQPGTKYSQYELLAGVLIPSGNNLAFLLARWSAGSDEAFVARMNEEALKLGMSQTQYADPSGVSPLNRSTAADQLKLAQAMMANPLLAGIVGLKQTSLPYAGTVFNVNSLLGQNNLVGVKTGWTEDAGGCFLFAADWPVDGQSVRIYGIVMGQDTLADAFTATRNILNYVGGNLHVETVVSKQGEPLQVTTEWGAKTTAVPANDAKVVVLAGTQVATSLSQDSLKSSDVKRGAEVSRIVVTAGDQKVEVPLMSQGKLNGASLKWRLLRPPGTPW